MLHRTAGRCVTEATVLNTSSVSRCCYSTTEIKDLIDQTKSSPLGPKKQGRSKISGVPATSFDELIRQRLSQRTEGIKPFPRGRLSQYRSKTEESRLAQEVFDEYQPEIRMDPRNRRQSRPGNGVRSSKPPVEEPWSAETEALRFPAAAVPSTGGRPPRAKRGRSKRFGDENEEGLAEMTTDVSEKDLETDELWDVDADAMRAFRRLSVWRNPVIGDEQGRPALFRSVKTGYDIFAEERTQFRLGDTSASWGGNRPTGTSQAEVGGPGGEYGLFLPERLRRLTGVDSIAMKPADLASLNLALSVNLTPREREDAAATVEDIISRSQSTQNKRRV